MNKKEIKYLQEQAEDYLKIIDRSGERYRLKALGGEKEKKQADKILRIQTGGNIEYGIKTPWEIDTIGEIIERIATCNIKELNSIERFIKETTEQLNEGEETSLFNWAQEGRYYIEEYLGNMGYDKEHMNFLDILEIAQRIEIEVITRDIIKMLLENYKD